MLTRSDLIEYLNAGREALGQIARHTKLTTPQIRQLARADQMLEEGVEAVETALCESAWRSAARSSVSLCASYVFALAKELPDTAQRDDLIEWHAHLELLARDAPVLPLRGAAAAASLPPAVEV